MTRIGVPYWSGHAKSALFCPVFAISLDCTQASVDLSCDEPRVLELAIRTDSRRPTVSLDRSASRAHCQHSQGNLPPTQAPRGEILTTETRGRKYARQALMWPRSGRRPKNKSTLSFNFKCHPQAPASGACRRISPLTFAPSRCELQAPEAILGLLHRGAKGVAVVTRLFSPDLESGWHAPRGHARSRSTRSATLDLAGSLCRTLPRGCVLRSVQRPAPDAALLLSVIVRARALRSTRRVALMGSACEAARTSVLPWTFGQGRPHAGG